MGLVLFHVTEAANRESIRRHGLDWRMMNTTPGIAGSEVPECAGVFLARNGWEAKWFVEMGRRRGVRAIDVWEVSLDLDLDLSGDLPPDGPLVDHEDGYLYCTQPIPPQHLKLIDPEALGDE
jgi:hypothetical protein